MHLCVAGISAQYLIFVVNLRTAVTRIVLSFACYKELLCFCRPCGVAKICCLCGFRFAKHEIIDKNIDNFNKQPLVVGRCSVLY